MSGIRLAGYRPGVLGTLVAWQAETYADSHGFGAAFEAKVAREMADFLDRLDPARDLFLTAWQADGALAGGLVMDNGDPADGDLGHLRWVYLVPAVRGQGLAADMLRRALDCARNAGKAGCYLTTIDGLDAASRLYAAAGFTEASRSHARSWGREVLEIRLERRFARDGDPAPAGVSAAKSPP